MPRCRPTNKPPRRGPDMSPNLYEIEARYHAALALLYDEDTPEDVAFDTIESVEGEMEVKAEAYAAIICNLEHLAAGIREQEKRQAERRKSMEAKADRLRDRLLEAMESGGIPRFETARFRIAVRANPEKVVIDDEAAVPLDYKREIPAHYEADKALMKAAMKDGYAIPGAHLELGKRLEIR